MKTPTKSLLGRFPAFTLVELIVVITIVGILSTVGFISYSGYLAGARDSNRYSQMTKLSDSLQVYAATKSLPLPDDYIEITTSGETIAYQGYVGTDVLETIDYTNGGKDPKDDSFFTYFLSRDRKSLQLLAFMEEGPALSLQSQTSHANDYENRFPVTYGHKLGVLTDVANTPIQELSSITGSLDISNVSLTLRSFLSDGQFVEGTGTAFADLGSVIPQRGKFWTVRNNTYTVKCEYANDITIGSYVVQACNIGAEYTGDVGTRSTYVNSICSDGYHIPSQSEWLGLGSIYNGTSIANDLKIQSGSSPYYGFWSSTVFLGLSMRLYYVFSDTATDIAFFGTSNAFGTSTYYTRCFKD